MRPLYTRILAVNVALTVSLILFWGLGLSARPIKDGVSNHTGEDSSVKRRKTIQPDSNGPKDESCEREEEVGFNGASEDSDIDCMKAPPPLPKGCIVYHGHPFHAQGLHCWATRGFPSGGNIFPSIGILSGCALSSAQVFNIADRCVYGHPKSKFTPPPGGQPLHAIEQLICANTEINSALKGTGSFCRHFARCSMKVLERMRFNQSLINRQLTLLKRGHVWNEVHMRAYSKIYFDAGWGSVYSCPEEGLTPMPVRTWPYPTPVPTPAPTPIPVNPRTAACSYLDREQCNGRDDCRWIVYSGGNHEVCEDRPLVNQQGYADCSRLGMSECLQITHCEWTGAYCRYPIEN